MQSLNGAQRIGAVCRPAGDFDLGVFFQEADQDLTLDF
jgi:hypothetical protein